VCVCLDLHVHSIGRPIGMNKADDTVWLGSSRPTECYIL